MWCVRYFKVFLILVSFWFMALPIGVLIAQVTSTQTHTNAHTHTHKRTHTHMIMIMRKSRSWCVCVFLQIVAEYLQHAVITYLYFSLLSLSSTNLSLNCWLSNSHYFPHFPHVQVPHHTHPNGHFAADGLLLPFPKCVRFRPEVCQISGLIRHSFALARQIALRVQMQLSKYNITLYMCTKKLAQIKKQAKSAASIQFTIYESESS